MKSVIYKITLLFLLTGLSLQIKAQSGRIQGQLTSAEGPLAYANLLLNLTKDSSMVKAAITDEQGQFVFPGLAAGDYFIEASYVGLQTYQSQKILVESRTINLPPIILEPNTAEIDAVEVTAKRPMIEALADKTVFNIENTLNSTGTDGFELLRKAPGVVVDNNNNIIVDGKTGVQIFINGKPSILAGDDLVAYLQTLQASDISAIEIITQPSSKYDAAGNAGIINIKLKKDKRLGTNGNLSVGFAHGRNSRYNSSLSLNNRSKKTNIFGTYSNRFGDSWDFINLNRFQNGVQYDSRTEGVNSNTAHNGKIGLDYFANDKHTFGVLFNGNFFDRERNEVNRTPIIPLNTGELSQTLIANNYDVSNNYNITSNFNYRFQDTLGNEVTFDIDYGQYSRDANNFQPNTYITGDDGPTIFENNSRMITPTNIDIFTVKLDYALNALGGKATVGLKYSSVITDNDFQFFDVFDEMDFLNEMRSNRFEYNEQINAAYVNYNKKWNKWNLQVGLRAEQTVSEGDLTSAQSTTQDNVKRNYLDWFPSGGLTFAPSYKSSWALTYSRRIQRPTYQSLNPFESQLNELSFSRGNPFLQPQYTDNLKLSHTHKYRLTTSISYSYISDFFAKVTVPEGETRNYLITKNVADQEIINLGISYPFDVNKWWSVYMSVNAYRASYIGTDESFVSVDQNTLSFYAQNSFSLPAGLRFEVSGWYNSPSVWGGTYLTKSMGSLDLAVQKKFLNDKLSLRISMSDVLFTSPWKADMRFGDLYIDGSGGWESRQVRVNLSYAFGNQNVKKSRSRKTGLEAEGNRVGN